MGGNQASVIAASLQVWFVATGVALFAQTSDATATPIKHLVVIVQENISFDHYFATYPRALNPPGEPRFLPRPGTPPINGLTAPLLTSNPNSFQPFRLDRSQQLVCGPTPGYTAEQRAYHGGLMDKFPEFAGQITATTPPCDFGLGTNVVMGYYDGNTVTALWNYAQHFAMSDNFYGSTFGQSAAGHMNLLSGQTHGAVTAPNVASSVVQGTLVGPSGPGVDDCNQTGIQTTMTGRNLGDLLNAKGVTWGWFSAGFAPTSRSSGGTAICDGHHTSVGGIYTSDYYVNEPFQRYASTANPHHFAPSSVFMVGHTDQANHQYDLSDFWDAASTGNLPAVSFLKAASYQNGHPQASDPSDEQTFLVDTLNQLQMLPDWDSTAVMITYDDSGGWYDHVMPPIVNGSYTSADALIGDGTCGVAVPGAYQGRCGYGPRMPILIVSPWAKVNFVDHGITEQASILRFIEDNWALGRIGDQSFDERAGPLLNMFDFSHPGAKRLLLNPTTGEPIVVRYERRVQ